jgi:serine/threonine protein kinase
MYVLMSNELPFDGPNEKIIFDNIRNQAPNLATKLLSYRSIESKDLLKKCLYRMPTTRIKINDAVQHGWVRRHGIDDVDKRYIVRALEQFRTFNQTNEL